jgi:glucokinase
MDAHNRFVGVDIGGTKIAAAVVRADAAGVIERRVACPTPRAGGRAVLRAAAELVAELAAGLAAGTDAGPVAAVGVGAPGVIDAHDGSVRSATDILPGWAGTPVRAELERLTGLPVTVDNDVRVMAHGELRAGAARGYRDAVFVSLGTGVGGALARDGRIVRGPHGTTGELAHLLVPAAGAIACGCGRFDHLEALAAGPAIAASYAERAAVPGISLPEVAARMADGDRVAREVIASAGTLLGRALAGLLAAVDAEILVVGGGVSHLGAALLDPLAEALRGEALAPLREIPVRGAEFGTDAPLIGAGLLAAEATATAYAEAGKNTTMRGTS